MIWSCTPSMEVQNRSISLCASSCDVLIESALQTKAVKAEPYSGSPSTIKPLNAALWFSYKPGLYSHAPKTPQNLPCATTVSYENSSSTDITYDNNILQYPIATDENYAEVGDNVYCVGLYPANGWGELTVTEVNSATHSIDGSEDLMVSDQMVGSYSKNFPAQTYKHLLTWIKVNLSATSIGATKVWGNVESLTIVSPKNNVKISFSNDLGQDGTPKASTISYGGSHEDFQLELPEDKNLSITTRTFGQVLCAPPATAEKNAQEQYEYTDAAEGNLGYIIKVKTKNLSEKEIFIPIQKEDNTLITDTDYTRGKLFVINLRFNDIAVIEGVCTLKQWDDQSSDIYLK